MKKPLVCLLLALFLTLTAVCALGEGAPITVADMYGREVTISEPATRVVALTASDCEILCALGCEDAIVGRGTYCDYPPSIMDIPAVESGMETNLEQIVALQPQILFMSDMSQTKEQVEALEAAGIRVVLSDANDIEGVYAAIRMIGKLMGKEAEAETLVTDMQAAFSAISANSENTGKTVYFEVSPLQWGLWTAGSNTFMDEIANMCGVTNAFADLDGWQPISEEQVLQRDPDYIVTITMYYGEGPTPVEEIISRPGWESIKAVANGKVYNADSNEISRPGPRLKNAAQSMYDFLSAE